MNDNKNSAPSSPALIFTCSGAADVGEMADRIGRRLRRDGVGKMSCMAGIGAGLGNFIDSAKTGGKVLVIDGCPVDCGKKMMEGAGISGFSYLRVTDHGFEKGKSPVNDDAIEKLCAASREILA